MADNVSLGVADLRATGLYFADRFKPKQVRSINRHLQGFSVYPDAHIPETARREGRGRVPRTETKSPCVCVELADALTAPFLFERALELTEIARAFLKCSPVAYSVNAFWTRPGPVRPDIQEKHCDKDDPNGFLVMFVYLTDVLNRENGPHEIEGPDGTSRAVYGPAGTVFLANTSLPHRGIQPSAGERGIAWWRWGASARPPANVWDKNEPVPSAAMGARYPRDPGLREVVRLLVTPP